MLDVSGCDNAKISDGDNITAFTKELVRRIDMVAYGEPVVARFATHDPGKAGYSMMQLIETSNLAAHFVERDNTMYLDVFSCKTYNIDDVQDVVREYFGAEKIRVNYITRNA